MKSQFLDLLHVSMIDDKTWVLDADMRYQSRILGDVVTVPKGFTTNFASVPRLPLAYVFFGGVANQASTVHDYLYATHITTRYKADCIFREAMALTNVSWIKRNLMWLGVRVYGGSHF
jgi:hypothetical protein